MRVEHEKRTVLCEKSFGATVLKVRGLLLVTQEEMAKALKMSSVTINRWENGKTEASYLSKKIFLKYCEEQGLSIEGVFL